MLRIVMLLLLVPTLAFADKPKAAAAKTVADKWSKALYKTRGDKPDFADITALTGDGFRVIVQREQPDSVCDKTVTDRAKLPEALKCVSESSAVFAPWTAWKAKDAKNLWGALKENEDAIKALAKTHQLFVHYEEGEGIVVIAIVAVGQGADKKPVVSAAFAAELYN